MDHTIEDLEKKSGEFDAQIADKISKIERSEADLSAYERRRKTSFDRMGETLEHFYGMDGASGPVEVLKDLLYSFFEHPNAVDGDKGYQAAFRQHTDDHISYSVYIAGEIMMFLTRLHEDWNRAKEYFPERN